MASEIELKLSLPEEAQRALLRHALLRQASEKRTDLLANIYYDTPDLKLRRRGIALRLRRQGRAWLQTVKCAGEASGGLSARPEWETPHSGRFDFSTVDDPAVRAFLEKPGIRARLMPVFETNFRRTTWRFGGVLLMLDRGWVAAGGRRETISELELELADGGVGDLFELADHLAARLPLAPAPLSKAERGYRLHEGIACAPYKAGELPLTAEQYERLTPLSACRAIAMACLEHLQHNHGGAIGSDDPEYIHQMRVATRRLRACLRLFGPLLPAAFAEAVIPPLRALMTELGQVRDLDVLLDEIKAPVVQALPDEPRLKTLADHLEARRQAARGAAIQALRSPRYGQLTLRLLSLLHEPPFNGAGVAVPQDVVKFSDDRLQKLHRRVRRLARSADLDEPETLHALRIGVKRLRYALEFFAPLSRGKSRRRLARSLADIQGTLGQLNDLANADRLLADCAATDPQWQEAVGLIGGWHARRRAKLVGQVARLLPDIRRLPPVA